MSIFMADHWLDQSERRTGSQDQNPALPLVGAHHFTGQRSSISLIYFSSSFSCGLSFVFCHFLGSDKENLACLQEKRDIYIWRCGPSKSFGEWLLLFIVLPVQRWTFYVYKQLCNFLQITFCDKIWIAGSLSGAGGGNRGGCQTFFCFLYLPARLHCPQWESRQLKLNSGSQLLPPIE